MPAEDSMEPALAPTCPGRLAIRALACLCLLFGRPLWAEQPSIAILDFELNDLTDLPQTAEEIARTASLRSLVEQALIAQGGVRVLPLASAAIA